MNVLITGCAGFLGHNLAKYLLSESSENFIVGVDNFFTGKKEFIQPLVSTKQFLFVESDCRDLENRRDLPRVDRIFHFAANSDIAAAMDNPKIDFELGIETTYSMLEFARKNNVKSFVFSSGSGVYGERPNEIFNEESFVGRPTSTYGATKLASESLISAYSFMFDIKSTVFRFCNLVGKNQTHGVVFDFINKLKLNLEVLNVLGDGTQTKPYLHLDDALVGIKIAIEEQADNFDVFNLSNSTSTSVREIAELVVKELGTPSTRILYGQADRGWKADIPKYAMSSKKLLDLGWEISSTSEDAVKKSIRENSF